MLRCSTGDTVVTADRMRVRLVVIGNSVLTMDAVFTRDRRRVRRLVTGDPMVMGDAVIMGDTVVMGTGEHGCRNGHR